MENTNYAILSFGKKYQGILKLVGAVLAFLLTLGSIIHFFNISGYFGISSYPVFAEVLYNICLVLGILLMIAGFCILGIMLLLKPKHIMVALGIGLITLGEFLACLEELFYFFWQSGQFFSYYYGYPYLAMIFLSLFAAVAWAFPAAAAYAKDKRNFRNITLVFVILPAVLFLIHMVAYAVTGFLFFSDFCYILFEFALLAVVGIVILSCDGRSAMDSIREMNNKNAEQRWQEAKKTQPGQTAYQAQNQAAQNQAPPKQTVQPQAIPAEGYISILKLIILGIVTCGIYIYIWIYKTTKFLDYRLNRQGSFSPGVEVVLCLFIPFYFIYWIYKQTKATEQAHQMVGNPGSNDLAIINILLCVFGLGIVAYALLQDQINKLCTGYTAPPNYERPPQTNTAAESYNFDPMTGKPIRKETVNDFNFDPMTGEPIRKEAPAENNEVFKEIPIQQESPKEEPVIVVEETPADPVEETPVEIVEEVPAEPAEENPFKVVTEIPEADKAEETITETIEETAQEVPAEEAPCLTAEQEENLKMLERLLEAGVLGQDEFDAKKKSILNA